jgi:hypothetical protein
MCLPGQGVAIGETTGWNRYQRPSIIRHGVDIQFPIHLLICRLIADGFVAAVATLSLRVPLGCVLKRKQHGVMTATFMSGAVVAWSPFCMRFGKQFPDLQRGRARPGWMSIISSSSALLTSEDRHFVGRMQSRDRIVARVRACSRQTYWAR